MCALLALEAVRSEIHGGGFVSLRGIRSTAWHIWESTLKKYSEKVRATVFYISTSISVGLQQHKSQHPRRFGGGTPKLLGTINR